MTKPKKQTPLRKLTPIERELEKTLNNLFVAAIEYLEASLGRLDKRKLLDQRVTETRKLLLKITSQTTRL